MKIIDAEVENVVKTRLETKYKEGRMNDIYQLDQRTGENRKYTPKDQMDEVWNNTALGQEILLKEAKLMNFIKSKI